MPKKKKIGGTVAQEHKCFLFKYSNSCLISQENVIIVL